MDSQDLNIMPPFIPYLDFELNYHLEIFQKWMLEHPLVPIYSCIGYVLFVGLGSLVMKNREPFNLKIPLFLWNLGLAVFSICGTIRMYEAVSRGVLKHGFPSVLCHLGMDSVQGIWIPLFMASKFVEFGDTAFIVLRKKKLMFLHWYHHVTVLLFTWYAVVTLSATGRWFIVMNFFVHSIMYSYYALQAINIRLPKVVSMAITSIQMTQMLGGVYFIWYTATQLVSNKSCDQTLAVVVSGGIMYASYFALFLNFFCQAYVYGRKYTRSTREQSKPVNGTVMNGKKKHNWWRFKRLFNLVDLFC